MKSPAQLLAPRLQRIYEDAYKEGYAAALATVNEQELCMRCVEQANKLITVDSADTVVAAARAFYKFVKDEK